MITSAPAADSRRASPKPRPLLAPVMIASFPERSGTVATRSLAMQITPFLAGTAGLSLLFSSTQANVAGMLIGMALRAGARRQPVIGCAAALVFGGLPALAFPAPSWWWLAWFGLVPLLLVVRAAPTSWEGALRAWTGMGGFVLATQYWLVTSAGPMLVLLAAGLGVLWLPAGWLAHRLLSVPVTTCRVGAALVVVPSAWVAAEAVRSWQSLGGPWALLGASQWSQPVTLASASLGGVWLTSFLLVATNTAIASVLVCRATGGRLVALGCVIGCAGLGPASYLLGSVPVGGPTVRVALVQAGDIADAAARLAAGEEFTAAVADQRPDLVVWGKAASDKTSPAILTSWLAWPSCHSGWARICWSTSTPRHRTGNLQVGGACRRARSCGQLPEDPVGSVWRICAAAPAFRLDHPLQQGRRKGSAARRRAGGVGGELLAYRPVDQLRDDLLRSDPARRAARAALLVYQSSTSTFQGSWAQPQLAAQPAVRAVEAGIPAVHASLSGDSSAFDTRGRRLAWCSAEFNGAIVVNVPLASNVTLYLRLGDWVPVTAFVVMGAGFAVFLRRSLARVSDCADK